MPEDHDKDVYPVPPRKTPVVDQVTTLPNPALILSKLFYYSVDVPVTTFRGDVHFRLFTSSYSSSFTNIVAFAV